MSNLFLQTHLDLIDLNSGFVFDMEPKTVIFCGGLKALKTIHRFFEKGEPNKSRIHACLYDKKANDNYVGIQVSY